MTSSGGGRSRGAEFTPIELNGNFDKTVQPKMKVHQTRYVITALSGLASDLLMPSADAKGLVSAADDKS